MSILKLVRSSLLVVCLVLAGTFVLPGTATAETREATESYVAGNDIGQICDEEANVGGVCFDLEGDEASVDITIDDASGLDVPGLYDFRDAAGNSLVGLNTFCGSVEDVAVPAGAVELGVFVAGPAFSVVNGCPSPASGTTGTVTATFELGASNEQPIDVEPQDCLEPVPASVGVAGVTDEGQTVVLDVHVLVDGPSVGRAQEVMATAGNAYEPLGIDLVATTFESVTFTGTEAQGLIDQAKAHVGGERPDGTDIVYVFTDKDIAVGSQTGVAGLADCLGGVRYPTRAFAVGEDFSFEDMPFEPFTFYVNATAKIAAHEIGHLMGAHHHYANCVEGLQEETPEEPSPCTLMFNAVDFGSINFSVASGAVVRGHAVDYAAP